MLIKKGFTESRLFNIHICYKKILRYRETTVLASKVHTYISRVPQCMPLAGIGTLPPPLSLASATPPPPGTTRGGAHSPAGEGLGKSQFRQLEKSLALCLICDTSGSAEAHTAGVKQGFHNSLYFFLLFRPTCTCSRTSGIP
jgi:hypothetical protein